jgi:hypothetical protein
MWNWKLLKEQASPSTDNVRVFLLHVVPVSVWSIIGERRWEVWIAWTLGGTIYCETESQNGIQLDVLPA